MSEKVCRNCGQPFTPPAGKDYSVCCSWDCQQAYQQARDSGFLQHLPPSVQEAVRRMEAETPPPPEEQYPF